MLALTAVACLLFSAPCADPPPLESLRTYLATPAADRKPIADQPFATAALSKDDAATAANLLYADSLARLKADRAAEWKAKSITAAGQTMKFDYRTFGEKPKRGRALFISMHGGGSAPAAVNESQWQNQIGLYKPAEGVYLAPRAPTDSWNMWHQAHIDALFDRLIEDAVACADVDPDRVYLMGYSAGGDGVYQLAPRMADRFAAAAMMAGHPNDASPLGLRNIGFTIHVGANDNGYNRNKMAAEWKQKLADLRQADPEGYAHEVHLHEGRGHWMNLEDKAALPWMAEFTRDPTPDRIVWLQDDITHSRFYWLSVDEDNAVGGARIEATVTGQTVEIESSGVSQVSVRLSDEMVDLDQPVSIVAGGSPVYEGVAPRTILALWTTTVERGDPALAFCFQVTVDLD